MEMGVLVHPQLGLRFGAALPGASFIRKTALLRKNMILLIFFNAETASSRGDILKTRDSTGAFLGGERLC